MKAVLVAFEILLLFKCRRPLRFIKKKTKTLYCYLKNGKSNIKAAVVIKIMVEDTPMVLKAAKLFDDGKQ